MFERFSPFSGLGPEKKLPWKFGSVAVNSLSLQPVFPVPGSALKKRSLIGLHITIQVVQERVPLYGGIRVKTNRQGEIDTGILRQRQDARLPFQGGRQTIFLQ